VIFTRQQLYDLVWSKPVKTLTKQYHISDHALRKICANQQIPLPKAGHWEKLRYGKKVVIEPLPPTVNTNQEITIHEKEEGEDFVISESPYSVLKKKIQKLQSLRLL